MSWFLLLLAGLLEVLWALGLKAGAFARLGSGLLTLVALAASLLLLALALRQLPLGTAYAIWTGIGVVGTVVAGIWVFGESMDAGRLASVGLILVGIVGLKLSGE